MSEDDSSRSESARDPVRAFYARRSRMAPEAELAAKQRQIGESGLPAHVLDEAARVGGPEVGCVVDFGGGSGAILDLLASRQRIRRPVCYDLALPRSRLAGIEYVSGSPEDLSSQVPAASVDLILAVEVIEHVYDPDATVELFRRLLRPSGSLLLTTPNLSSAVSRLSLLLGWQPLDSDVSTVTRFGFPGATRWDVVGHIRVFTFRALLEFLSYHGWVIDRAYTVPQGPTSPTGERLTGALGTYARLDRIASRFGRSLASHSLVVARPGYRPGPPAITTPE